MSTGCFRADGIEEPDTGLGGCVLCASPEFERDGFGDRTVIICDQCEREFHVGCLRSSGRADLHELPEGDWFCSTECGVISQVLRSSVAGGITPLSEDHGIQILRVGLAGDVAGSTITRTGTVIMRSDASMPSVLYTADRLLAVLRDNSRALKALNRTGCPPYVSPMHV